MFPSLSEAFGVSLAGEAKNYAGGGKKSAQRKQSFLPRFFSKKRAGVWGQRPHGGKVLRGDKETKIMAKP